MAILTISSKRGNQKKRKVPEAEGEGKGKTHGPGADLFLFSRD